MKPWLDVCRDAVGDIKAVLAELPTRVEREPVLQDGEGGDETTAIDAAFAETAVVHRLERLDEGFTLVSEELGERMSSNGGGPPRVVCDPIDGSLNAKRGTSPFLALAAVAEGGTMDDIVFGYVYDFGSGEEWTAERGGGAYLDGRPARRARPKDVIEILSFEATTTAEVAQGGAHGCKAPTDLIMGSLALSLCHLAAGRVDAVRSLKPARSVDTAAGQLLVRECGLAIDLFEDRSFGRALDLAGRSRVVAAGTTELCRTLETALTA